MESIIPALSNNSHELFHSNLWKWLMDVDKAFIQCFFEDCNLNLEYDIEREKNNTDIIIKNKKNKQILYVIENKLKSIPQAEQLNKYKEVMDKKTNGNCQYLLVYLVENEKLNIDDWKSIDYIQLAKRIVSMIEKIKDNKHLNKYYDILIEYCKYVIVEFQSIKDSEYVNSEYYGFTGSEIKNKRHIKDGLKVIYQKLKSEKIKNKIDDTIDFESLKKKFDNKGFWLFSLLGYNHGKPCFTYRVQSKKFDYKYLKDHTALEIQLEGDQYRHMIRLLKRPRDRGKKNKDRQKYYDEAKSILKGTDFWNKSFVSNMKNDFCSYDDGRNSIAIYRYSDRLKEKDISYKKVAKYIIKDLDYIFEKLIIKKSIKELLNK